MKRIITAIALGLMWLLCLADSPLTSTTFYEAYPENPYVNAAIGMVENGDTDLPVTTMNYLADAKQPISARLAVVNAIGWNFESTSISNQLCDYLMTRFKVKDEEQLIKKIDAGTLAVYAYAKAMSNYFVVTEAQALAHQAVEKDKTHSFSIAFIASLIDAQVYLDSDWAMVYKVVANVLHDGSLNLDMRQEAIDKVMEYINLYQEYDHD